MAIGTTTTGILNSQAIMPVGTLGHAQTQWSSQQDFHDTVFSGYVRVDKLLNGYVVHFSKNEGSITQKYVALTIKEVNEIITSEMVKFKLES
jgi:hypothetical protein